jgi:hypothetical protein
MIRINTLFTTFTEQLTVDILKRKQNIFKNYNILG